MSASRVVTSGQASASTSFLLEEPADVRVEQVVAKRAEVAAFVLQLIEGTGPR